MSGKEFRGVEVFAMDVFVQCLSSGGCSVRSSSLHVGLQKTEGGGVGRSFFSSSA